MLALKKAQQRRDAMVVLLGVAKGVEGLPLPAILQEFRYSGNNKGQGIAAQRYQPPARLSQQRFSNLGTHQCLLYTRCCS